MAAELIYFLAGALALLLPGIWLARWIGAGQSLLEYSTYGSTLGLALAVYLASLISHFNLEWFYPTWTGLAIVCLGGCWRSIRRTPLRRSPDSHWESWLWVILVVVGVSRFAFVLPERLPDGWDPAFHMILARKIQLTQHAIWDWRPFAEASLNYPTGSHLLIVILSGISRLPLPTVFKDLIPFLGVLTTAQVYLLGRRVTGSAQIGLYSAAAYGLWAWGGSIDYFRWGGLPNQLGMLLFLAVLSLWLDDGSPRRRMALMALLYAAIVLVHHHVMVVSGAILAVAMIGQIIRPVSAASWKILALALVAAALLDSFYLVPYALKASTLGSTRMIQLSERMLDLVELPASIGYLMCATAAIGLGLWIRGRFRCHPLVVRAVATLAVMFIACEYVWPLLRRSRGLGAATIFTPSRFLSDANYFLVIFAAFPVAWAQKRWRLSTIRIIGLMLLGGMTQVGRWTDAPRGQDTTPSDGFIQACDWIARNTSPMTIVVNQNAAANTVAWAPYLTWRRCTYVPIPASEPVIDMNSVTNHVNGMMSGQIPPDAPDMRIVRVTSQDKEHFGQVLWFDQSGDLVVQLWPPMTDSGKR
jgi:hypothetical protein